MARSDQSKYINLTKCISLEARTSASFEIWKPFIMDKSIIGNRNISLSFPLKFSFMGIDVQCSKQVIELSYEKRSSLASSDWPLSVKKRWGFPVSTSSSYNSIFSSQKRFPINKINSAIFCIILVILHS